MQMKLKQKIKIKITWDKKLTTTCMYHLKKGVKWIKILKEESILCPVYMNTKTPTLRVWLMAAGCGLKVAGADTFNPKSHPDFV